MALESRTHAESLLNMAGRTYGIQIRRDEVQQALRDDEHGAAFVEWAVSHLTPDTLLTADELALYTALDRSGQVDKLAALHDLAQVQAISQDDIRTAIDELKRSTDSISKQTETLRQQREALARLVSRSVGNDTRRQDLEASRKRSADSEQKRLAAEVEELSHSIGFRIAELEQQAKDSGLQLNQTVDGLLHSDDKLFTSLQKLGRELHQQDPEEAQTVERLREICMRLIKTTVETVRTKLDTVYLTTLLSAQNSSHGNPASQDEVRALQEEVESLYSEILPVAQMSVEQQHLEPELRAITARSGQSVGRSAVAVAYINECLDYLLDRVKRLQDRIETHKSHQAASAAVASIAKTEIAVEAQPAKKTTPVLPASPIRNASPVRSRATTTTSRSNRHSLGQPDEPPLETLLQTLALSIPVDPASPHDQVTALARALSERSAKADDVARNAQENFETSAIAHLEDAKLAIQLLRDSVMAESPFGEVKLVDAEIESSIEVLAQEVDKVKETLERMDGRKGDGKSERRDELLRRWGP